jgi:hypothetical protein
VVSIQGWQKSARTSWDGGFDFGISASFASLEQLLALDDLLQVEVLATILELARKVLPILVRSGWKSPSQEDGAIAIPIKGECVRSRDSGRSVRSNGHDRFVIAVTQKPCASKRSVAGRDRNLIPLGVDHNGGH